MITIYRIKNLKCKIKQKEEKLSNVAAYEHRKKKEYKIEIYCEALKTKNDCDTGDAPPTYKATQTTLLPQFLQQNKEPTTL